jgi:hypothetical protein
MLTDRRPIDAAEYDAAYTREQAVEYPIVDALEAKSGYALKPGRYLPAAYVLACPVKANPPNWQHGRVLYALTREYLAQQIDGAVTILDIGTAKGYSALCLQWALSDSGLLGRVISVDVIGPMERVYRNTVADPEGRLTLPEILTPWQHDARDIVFLRSTGIEWLTNWSDRVHVAFIDGKHDGHVVRKEGVLLSARQQSGDLAIFDDVHIPRVSEAVASLNDRYRLEYVELLPNRQYAIGRRR